MNIPANSPGGPPSHSHGWIHRLIWPAVIVTLALIALLAYRWTLRSAEDLAHGVGRGVGQIGGQVAGIAERFRSGSITTRFLASIPELKGAGLGNLELATSTVTETFSRSDERRIFWDRISLGETATEIRVPVTYRYHVPMDGTWELEISGQTCIVNAPAIRASLPPAIHTDRMEKKSRSDWLRFDGAEQMAELERSITPTLEQFAVDRRHLDLVREPCRRTLAEFVRSWLLAEDHWREDRFRSIIVVFDDESTTWTDARPTLALSEE